MCNGRPSTHSLSLVGCKVQAVDGSSSVLESGAGLLRKAEVDAHRKVAMQVLPSIVLLISCNNVVFPDSSMLSRCSNIGSEQQAAACCHDAGLQTAMCAKAVDASEFKQSGDEIVVHNLLLCYLWQVFCSS